MDTIKCKSQIPILVKTKLADENGDSGFADSKRRTLSLDSRSVITTIYCEKYLYINQFSDQNKSKNEASSFLSEPDDVLANKNSTGINPAKTLNIDGISDIQNERSFEASFDDSLVLAMKSTSGQNEGSNNATNSLNFDISDPLSENGCKDIRSWKCIGDVKLKATKTEGKNDEYCLRITESRVSHKKIDVTTSLSMRNLL